MMHKKMQRNDKLLLAFAHNEAHVSSCIIHMHRLQLAELNYRVYSKFGRMPQDRSRFVTSIYPPTHTSDSIHPSTLR